MTTEPASDMIAQVIALERIVEQTFLYDFYGELLTEHQKMIYEDVVLNDLTFSEVAREYGISRQSVHDMIRRCDRILEEYEKKLHLVEKFIKIKEKLAEIHRLTGEFLETRQLACIYQIEEISQEIDELEDSEM